MNSLQQFYLTPGRNYLATATALGRWWCLAGTAYFIGIASVAAQSPATVDAPPAILAPQLDARIDRAQAKQGKEKVERSRAGGSGGGAEELDQLIAAGDVQAALRKVDRMKKEKGRITEVSNGGAIEVLVDKGMAEGVAEAFRAKGSTEAERGNYVAAARHLKEASQRGSMEADYDLATLKAQRPGIGDIDDKPLELLSKAAGRGNARAAMELGLALERGAWLVDRKTAVMLEQSPSKARAWMERAALLGSEEAVFWLGLYHMRNIRSLVDASRPQAVELLLMVRRASPDLKDPSSGKTFLELEATGEIEQGLLAELKRREAKEKRDLALLKAESAQTGGMAREVKTAPVKYLETQQVEIGGHASRPVFNLVGFSPYRDVWGEGGVVGISGARIQVDAVAVGGDPQGMYLEIWEDGRLADVLRVNSLDKAAGVLVADRAATPKPSKKTRWRVASYHTFLSVFGAENRVGLRPGASADAADEIIVYDSNSGRRRRLYYDAELAAWVAQGEGRLAADFEFAPGTALLVKRTETAALGFGIRGVLPQTAFAYEPGGGVSLVSLQQNEFAAELRGADRRETRPIAASEVPVLVARGKNAKWNYARNGAGGAWWAAVGLQPTDLVNLVGESAVVCIKE